MSKNFRESLAEQMRDESFKEEWDSMEPEFQIINAMVAARKSRGLTQKQLAEITGINQADISRLENGNANPSLRTLRRLAAGMGLVMKIELVPAVVE